MSPLPRGPVFALVASFVFWSAMVLLRPQHPFGDLSNGKYTDHFSHMNSARLFPRVGLDLYRAPTEAHARLATRPEILAVPKDVTAGSDFELLVVEGWPADKPLTVNWSRLPRLYPPGDLVLTAPIALAYHFTSLSFHLSNELLIVLFLACMHASVYALLRLAWRGSFLSTLVALGPLPAVLLVSEMLHWTLEGFYEAALVGPLAVCAFSLRERRWVAAILAYSIAAFLHFRSFFFAPWVLFAAGSLAAEGKLGSLDRKSWGALAIAFVLSACSLGVFALVWPALHAMPISHNAVHWADTLREAPGLLPFAVVMGAALVAFAVMRQWLDAALVGWLAAMLVSMRETYPWDVVTLLLWPVVPVFARARRAPLVRPLRTGVVLFVAILPFRNAVVPLWLELLGSHRELPMHGEF